MDYQETIPTWASPAYPRDAVFLMIVIIPTVYHSGVQTGPGSSSGACHSCFLGTKLPKSRNHPSRPPPPKTIVLLDGRVSQVDSAYVLDIADADIALLPKGDNVIGDGKSNPLDDDIPDSSSAKTPT